MHRTAIALFVVLFVLHQDSWFWDDRSMVFGFIPVGLAYHAAFSLAAAALWLFTIKCAWPDAIEAWAEEGSDGPPHGGAKPAGKDPSES